MSGQRCLPSECWREENICRKALCYGFCRCFKTCLCSQVPQQTVFITMRTYSNKVYCRQFAVSRTTTSCSSRTERHARHSPYCRLPSFQCAWVHWTKKLAAEQSRSKFCALFSVDSVVANGVTSKKFRHWSAEASSYRFLGSAKPGHTEPSDWSAAKKPRMVIKAKGCHVEFCLD